MEKKSRKQHFILVHGCMPWSMVLYKLTTLFTSRGPTESLRSISLLLVSTQLDSRRSHLLSTVDGCDVPLSLQKRGDSGGPQLRRSQSGSSHDLFLKRCWLLFSSQHSCLIPSSPPSQCLEYGML
ncbi:hypothetical protein CKAN_00576300 [Cinnamomum micranthum f. kanehirae]|uniref:Uncharacterized protein n=1 Tax=Cinnamomum micranthum f. kanehirae TaxID=337451 RepID=A0A443NFJ4_9MAGN|nr:hypothetical protein CKAN_00576300 [Cinnamomum micranthum f. kanehirae]